ncbi:hypothetical protein [Nitrosomonas sp. Nm58]|uniref:hypothetical protein n=1 Tax=Nitrosomonas sp. Nm58 TaxID=200126 RepID=UPI00089AF6A3|nr:hypothetical protein [Nitrosomonas sp. Nm58]SDY98105.1 hypothetical protein SAMN05421754_10387 [Nitrosomonas sp. Nm58]
MTINNIEIENVRGIELLRIPDKILKNRPNILVAANGFGKTSIAVAFKSIASQTSLKLHDEARHLHSATKPAKISLDIADKGLTKKLYVTEAAHSNEIRKNLDIHVIGDMRRIKASARNMGGFPRASAKQVIDPIVICNKPNEVANPYKVSATKQAFGNRGRLLQNLDNALFASPQFIMRSTEFMEAITPLIKERRWTKIETIQATISAHSGDNAEAISAATADIEQILTEADFKLAVQIIVDTSDQDKNTAFLSLWQLVFLVRENLAQLNGYLEWLRYKEIKKSLKTHVADLNSSWKDANVKETKGKLVVELPDPSHISNGQRDILLLVAMFHVAKHQLTKEKAILIIDEVFDYLDDANLTVAQYYITELIEDYKRQGRAIYPIILTHLNPAFFKNYVFSNQNVIYLDKNHSFDSCDAMKKLISARNDESVGEEIKNNISKYFVHYHTDKFDFSADLQTISGTRSSWGKHGKFQAFTEEEFNKYKNNQPYDPLAICAITRRTIEMLAYRQIEHLPGANGFFNVKKTSQKLDWASQRGAIVPETHYLLRVIFDDGLHWNLGRDNTIPIVAKLGNSIIKKLIVELVSPLLPMGNAP